MRRFSELYETLDGTTRTNAKVEAMVAYLREAPAEDAAWAVFFLTGQRLKRLVSGRRLREWALCCTGLPQGLLADAHAAVGDSAETVTLLVHTPGGEEALDLPLHRWLEERILPLRQLPAEQQYAEVISCWRQLPARELFVLNKLLTGAFRVGVSQLLVVRALAAVSGLPRATIAHRLMGRWQPTAAWYRALLGAGGAEDDPSRPYPFFLASPLEQPPHELGSIDDWLAEWKWDGIRAQLIRRRGQVFLWSRGEELVTGRFPELAHAAARLPDGSVLDGEVLAWDEQGALPFAVLQTGIGRERGDWWKWKIDPLRVDAVLVYAQAGSGRRANLFTDYTFAVWQDDALVPIAKAYSGLSDREILALDRWIRRNTVERFGPVRQVVPEQVVELAFEGISRSGRHKSGIALRFPRITRWRTDKPAREADRLTELHALLRDPTGLTAC